MKCDRTLQNVHSTLPQVIASGVCGTVSVCVCAHAYYNVSKCIFVFCRVHKVDFPRLPHLEEVLGPKEKFIMDRPIQERKGYSYMKMLGQVFTTLESVNCHSNNTAC